MFQRFILGLTLGLMLVQPGPVAAQDRLLRTEEVRFRPGSAYATLYGRITARDFVTYTLRAQAGQRLGVMLNSANPATYFNLYAPGGGPGDEALATGEATPRSNMFDGILPASGIYSISVHLNRNAARDGGAAAYSLDVSITNEGADLQATPELWRVRAAGGLNLRTAPSTDAAIVTKLADNAGLVNHGCRMAKARRWCQVSAIDDPGLAGWVAADFLEEGDAEVALAPRGALGDTVDELVPGLVPGTFVNAIGKVECFPTATAAAQMCDFGVNRDGGGTGTVIVTLPDGQPRAILYSAGVPVSFIESESDRGIAFETKRQADGYSVVIGLARFVIPDAVIYGG
jgi:hypothetical protein